MNVRFNDNVIVHAIDAVGKGRKYPKNKRRHKDRKKYNRRIVKTTDINIATMKKKRKRRGRQAFIPTVNVTGAAKQAIVIPQNRVKPAITALKKKPIKEMSIHDKIERKIMDEAFLDGYGSDDDSNDWNDDNDWDDANDWDDLDWSIDVSNKEKKITPKDDEEEEDEDAGSVFDMLYT